jgi:hypothetical protein
MEKAWPARNFVCLPDRLLTVFHLFAHPDETLRR